METTFELLQVKETLQTIFPFVNVSTGRLGGDDLYILASTQQKEYFHNGYVENSNYTRLRLSQDGTLEQFVRSTNFPKLRKSKVKSIEHLKEKLNNLLTQQK